MKSLSETSFFLVFEEIVRRDRPDDGADAWAAAGVSWNHARHGYEGRSYGFAIELFEAECPAKDGWSLIVAKEHWWAGRRGEIIRSAHWAKPIRGSRGAILAWFRNRQREIEALQ